MIFTTRLLCTIEFYCPGNRILNVNAMTVESDSLGMFSLAVSIAQAIELYCPGNKILLYNIDAMTVESGSLGRFSLAISTVQAIGFYCQAIGFYCAYILFLLLSAHLHQFLFTSLQ